MKGVRAWHIVALLAMILLIRAVLCWSNGLLFTLFGLNYVFSYAAPMWLCGQLGGSVRGAAPVGSSIANGVT